MAEYWQSRQVSLIGEEATDSLKHKTVMVCGLGGVGGSACEAICRAGIGRIVLVDCDTVDVTNINRQAFATTKTVGLRKVQAAKERLCDINPDGEYPAEDVFLTPKSIPEIIGKYNPDYVIDAIDNVSAKIALAMECASRGVSLISSMGTGNKLNPEALKISDISKTSVCPLARVMRRELKLRGINHLTVLWSDEVPRKVGGQRVPASVSTVPPAAGILIAGRVLRDLIND